MDTDDKTDNFLDPVSLLSNLEVERVQASSERIQEVQDEVAEKVGDVEERLALQTRLMSDRLSDAERRLANLYEAVNSQEPYVTEETFEEITREIRKSLQTETEKLRSGIPDELASQLERIRTELLTTIIRGQSSGRQLRFVDNIFTGAIILLLFINAAMSLYLIASS